MNIRIKHIAPILCLALLALSFYAAQKHFKAPPPGTVPLYDSVYIDQMPVTNRDYKEFLFSLRTFYNQGLHDTIQKMPQWGLTAYDISLLQGIYKGDSMEYVRMITRTWMTYANDEQRYEADFRLKSSKFDDYPVVNIDYDQMKHYCVWRTDMVKLYYAVRCKTEKQRKKYPMNFKYRLVKRKEWEKALGYYFGDIRKTSNKKVELNKKIFNVARPYVRKRGRDFYYDTYNVAETLDKAIVTFNFKWVKSVGLGDISYFKFDGPKDWIGFRCACEILPPENVDRK